MFGTKRSKTNRLQKTTKYQRNEQITKYSNELKYGNRKLLGNTKHNQVKLVLAVFVSAICTNIALNYIKQTRYN